MALVRAHDIDGLEAHMATLHAGHVAGDLPASAVRGAFTPFTWTAPELASVADDWLAAYPASPYAMAASGWLEQGTAWRVRGDQIARYTYPDAFAAFNDHITEAQSHGWAAFNAAPDLIAASDLLLVNERAMGDLGVRGTNELVDAVMAATPNRGTLYRAATVFDPMWGGSLTNVQALCDRHATMVTSVTYPDTTTCVADLVLSLPSPRGELRDQAINILAAADWEGFEWHRFDLYQSIFTRSKSGLTPQDVVEELQSLDGVDYALAQTLYKDAFYNGVTPPDHSLQVAATQIILHTKETARRNLADDPGNPTLVGAVLFDTETAIDARPDRDTRLALWGEVLRVAPYDSGHWSRAISLDYEPGLDHYIRTAPFRSNTIAYANHSPQSLRITRSHLARAYGSFLYKVSTGEVDAADVDAALTCPIIHISRLFDAVCATDPQAENCNIGDQHTINQIADALSRAESNDLCEYERTADLRALVFQPVTAQVGTYTHLPGSN